MPPAPAAGKTYQGFGPNFWLYSADAALNNKWSEIDIFEINAIDTNQAAPNIWYQNMTQPYVSVNPAPPNGFSYGNLSPNTWLPNTAEGLE